ncbi:MAG: UvrD-helicase domain-containing protein [Minisyncoccia bacterium]
MKDIFDEKNYLTGLNSAQQEAVLTLDGPMLIIAGAGAGKTKTITHRIFHLIKTGVAPEKILAITFTNKAAKEMKERVSKLLGHDQTLSFPGSYNYRQPFISTFHSLGVKIIKDNAQIFGLTKNFTILDRADSLRLIKEALKEMDIDPKQFEPGKILNIISREKGNMTTADKYAGQSDKGGYSIGGVTARVWSRYEQLLSEEKGLDFDDLLLKSYLLLKNHPEILKQYQEQWHYIHIDEYQDTNQVQYMTVRLLAEARKNICVVGDVDQNIYSWRGADIQNLLRFEKDYPGTKVIRLEENYRSTQNIISVANEVISKNTIRLEKTLFTKKEEGEKITIFEAANEVEESRFVAREIKKLAEEGKVEPENIAVLYRANFQSRILEEAMLAESVPYQLLGTKFFERKEVKDILSYIRAGLSPESLGDVKRIINVPTRGLGKVTILKIFSGQKDTLPENTKIKIAGFYSFLEKIKLEIEAKKPSEVVKFVIKESGLEKELMNGTEDEKERLENMKELATLATKYDHLLGGEGIEKMLEESALATDQDNLEEKKKAVKLMTVHSAKGLEFDYVFVVGLEEDLFPHQKIGSSRRTKEEEEEERRLFYVAVTRARKKLYLSWAQIRTIYGSQLFNSPSKFLEDVAEDLCEKDQTFEYREKIIYLDI